MCNVFCEFVSLAGKNHIIKKTSFATDSCAAVSESAHAHEFRCYLEIFGDCAQDLFHSFFLLFFSR